MHSSPSSSPHLQHSNTETSPSSSNTTTYYGSEEHAVDPESWKVFDERKSRGVEGHARRGGVRGSKIGNVDWKKRVNEEDSGEQVCGGRSYLLSIPSETTLYILALLPPSVLLLCTTLCVDIHDLLEDDSVWRDCYINNFVGSAAGEGLVRSVGDVKGGRGWRKEAVMREKFIHRLSHSKTPTVTHDPRLNGTPPLISLSYPFSLPHQPTYSTPRGPSLLNISSHLGLASRSDPLNGKVLKGWIDSNATVAAGAGDGLVANPNALAAGGGFRLDVTATITPNSEPWNIVWGFRNGQVATTVVSSTAATQRAPTRTYRSSVIESHEGSVIDLKGSMEQFVSAGGEDGRVKLWHTTVSSTSAGLARRGDDQLGPKCVWTSGVLPRVPGEPLDGTILVAWEQRTQTIAAFSGKGDLRVWSGFTTVDVEVQDVVSGEVSIKPMLKPRHFALVSATEDERAAGSGCALEIDAPEGDLSQPIDVLLHRGGSESFERIRISFNQSGPPEEPAVSTSTYTSTFAACANLTYVKTEFYIPDFISLPLALSNHPSPTPTPPLSDTPGVLVLPEAPVEERGTKLGLGDEKFVIAGDEDGWVRIWKWSAAPQEGASVLPVKEWKAVDGRVTALESIYGLILVGCLDGTLKIFSPLSSPPSLVRTFSDRSADRHARVNLAAELLDPSRWAVHRVILERDLLVYSAGGKIVCWRAGTGKERDGKSPWKGKIVGKRSVGGGTSSRGIGGGGGLKGYHYNEILSEITEGRMDLHSQAQSRLTSTQETRAQMDSLADLGLTEQETVEYLMMLSRDEEEARRKEEEQLSREMSELGLGGRDNDENDFDEELDMSFDDDGQYLNDAGPSSFRRESQSSSASSTTTASQRINNRTSPYLSPVIYPARGLSWPASSPRLGASSPAGVHESRLQVSPRPSPTAEDFFVSPPNSFSLGDSLKDRALMDKEFPSISSSPVNGSPLGSRRSSATTSNKAVTTTAWGTIASKTSPQPNAVASSSQTPSPSVTSAWSGNNRAAALNSPSPSPWSVPPSVPSSPSPWGAKKLSNSALHAPLNVRSAAQSPSLLTRSISQNTDLTVKSRQEQEEEDLRLAIELSIAESMGR